jgi:hypothetical protein
LSVVPEISLKLPLTTMIMTIETTMRSRRTQMQRRHKGYFHHYLIANAKQSLLDYLLNDLARGMPPLGLRASVPILPKYVMQREIYIFVKRGLNK